MQSILGAKKNNEGGKIKIIAPIFKKGSKDEPGNYRPNSLTSVCGKILESITADSIVSHIKRTGLNLNRQHGFCKR